MNAKTRPPLLKSTELPVPRLELRWDPADAPPPEGYPVGTQACRYLIVIPLGNWDIRREDENGEKVRDVLEKELGCTVRSHGNPQLVWPESNSIDTPYRDGTHIALDSHALKIPAYATAGEHSMFIEPRAPSK
jgi:hypothetical protein